nr:serine hydrolase [Neobacillus mesonae]
MKVGYVFKGIIVIFLMVSLILPSLGSRAEAASSSSFSTKLSTELKNYIKKSGGTVTLQYKDITTGEVFQLNGKTSGRAASTIKLPLALYIMEQASIGKINLNKKLKYKSYHYYGGSGIIQKKKVGTYFTIRELVKYAMVYSDNIAFIMLKEYVGQAKFIKYMKSLGGQYAYPNGRNLTSANDLTIYANKLYQFSKKSPYGQELAGYLKKTVYNTTIPRGIKGVPIAHKVGMIPADRIYNDAAVVYDQKPFVLAIMTRNISYEKSQKVIAGVAAIVYKHHKTKTAHKPIETKGITKLSTNSQIENGYEKIYSASKLIKINKLYPSSKKIQYSFELNSDQTLKHGVKLDKNTQKVTRHYEYYPKTVFDKRTENIRFIFNVNSSGYISKVSEREKGSKRVLGTISYKPKTVYGKHSNRVTGKVLNVPLINQRPELPTGCEITAVTMMLQYKGAKVNKVSLAKEMPRHSSNPNYGYVGNPFTKRGWTIYPPALMGLVKKYAGSSVNLTGKSNATIEKQLYNNKPIMVLVSPMHGFTVHALVLTGYDQNYYYFNDCWTGKKNVKISKKEFNRIWGNQKKRAISY